MKQTMYFCCHLLFRRFNREEIRRMPDASCGDPKVAPIIRHVGISDHVTHAPSIVSREVEWFDNDIHSRAHSIVDK